MGSPRLLSKRPTPLPVLTRISQPRVPSIMKDLLIRPCLATACKCIRLRVMVTTSASRYTIGNFSSSEKEILKKYFHSCNTHIGNTCATLIIIIVRQIKLKQQLRWCLKGQLPVQHNMGYLLNKIKIKKTIALSIFLFLFLGS